MRFFATFIAFFVISSCGGGGSSTQTLTIPAPNVNFSANPISVPVGSDSTLAWSSTNASSCSASGAWSGVRGTAGFETVTISVVGNTSFTITCSGEGGNSSATASIEGFRQTDGVVVDGYISNANVFIDVNENFVADATENSTTSDNEGKFTIKYADGNLISLGGTDLDSQTLLDNLLISHKMIGHSDFKAITPLTSVAAFMQDSSFVNAALGIDATIDVFTFDPVANKGDGGINDYLYEKGNQLTVLALALQNIVNDLNATTETTQDYFKAIAEEVDAEFSNTATKVDIETPTFITNVINNILTTKFITMDEMIKTNTITALAGVLPIIQVQSTDDLTTAVIRFSLSTLQNDIVGVANGTATEELITSYTSDILNYIAEDQNIDSDEITPDINAIADTATVEEDGTVIINVVANDSYTTTAPTGISAGNGTNGSTTLAGSSPEQVVYTPNADFNGTDTFTYTITQGDKTSSAEVTVTVSAVNDAPSIDIASTIQVPENQTSATTVSVSDVDEDELTLSLGGTDAASFNLSSENILTFKDAPDYETKTSYGIILSLTDGTETVTKNITITITDVNEAPVFTSSASFSAAENQTAIGTVTAIDDEGDNVIFTISGSELAITSAGVLTFVSAPDFETKSVYIATVTASDGVNETTQDITININDVSMQLFVKTLTVSGSELFIHTVENTDSIGSIKYLIRDKNGYDLDAYEVMKLTFAGKVLENNRTLNDYGILNEATLELSFIPDFTSSPNFSAAENQTAIGTVTAKDANGDSVTFTVSGSELEITSAGVLTFASAPDYETKTRYTATVTASNGINAENSGVIVNVTDVNESPVFTSSASFNVEENQTAIGSVSATDPESETLIFAVSGSDLAIDSSSGVLTFLTAPDFETQAAYTATVTASDGENTTTQVVNINVTDVNEAPTITSSASFSVEENQTAIGTVTATDPESETLIFAVSNNPYDETDLAIDSSSGVLTFVTAPDFETTDRYYSIVTVSDGTFETEQLIIVNLINVNEAPEFTSDATFNVNENQTTIGTVEATDPEGEIITFSITGSEINIDSSSGAITFASAPDFETTQSYSATVTASDGTNETEQDITVNVNAIYTNGIADAIRTKWTKGIDFNPSVNSYGKVPSIQSLSRYTIFSKLSLINDQSFQPWGIALTFRPDSLNNGLIQISTDDSRDRAYLSIEDGAIKLKYGFSGISGQTGIQFKSNSTLTAGNWYSLYISYDGDNDIDGFDQHAFKIYLVSLTDGTLTDLHSNGTWSRTSEVFDNIFELSPYNSLHSSYEIGSSNVLNSSFDGIISAFTATTYLENELPTDNEIKTMALDPIKWLEDYKVNTNYRSAIHYENGQKVTSNADTFSLDSYESGLATQVFLMGDVRGPEIEEATILNAYQDFSLITNQVFPSGFGANLNFQYTNSPITDMCLTGPAIISDPTFTTSDGLIIGTVTATDLDTQDILTFTVSGTDTNIEISDVTLQDNTQRNVLLSFVDVFPEPDSYSAVITVSDGTCSDTQPISISVTAPELIVN